ncbi:MAG: hypothetical protein IPI34_07370 [bacterium]|nr:hypothetical protein [bacterium]
MLVSLRISQFGLVDDLVLAVAPGLTMLTGETGAGKSMIAGALSVLTGAPVPKDLVREGEDEAYVEGVFDLAERPRTLGRLREAGVLPGADGILVIRRELRRAGRNRVLINGILSSLQVLDQIGPWLISVQSQDQQRDLERSGHARDLLDELGGGLAQRAAVRSAWAAWQQAATQLADRRRDVAAGREQLVLWRYQRDELETAGLRQGEEAEIAESLTVARHAAELQSAAAAAHEAVTDEERGAQARLARAARELERQAGRSSRLAGALENLRNAEDLAGEAARVLERFLDGFDAGPEDLEALESRAQLYQDLQRKYRCDVTELNDLLVRLRERVSRQEAADDDLAGLESALDEAGRTLARACSELRRLRRGAAPGLARAAEDLIRPLALPDLALEFRVTPRLDPDGPLQIDGAPCRLQTDGADDVELFVRTNPGEKAAPVAAIASGGEKSRIHLGLTVLRRRDEEPPLLLFDEVDAGLGMDNALPVAGLLRRLAAGAQVVCITHLPTMAVHGGVHWLAKKGRVGTRTLLEVGVLDPAARVDEIARLLGGAGVKGGAETQRSYARDLLREAGHEVPAGGRRGRVNAS